MLKFKNIFAAAAAVFVLSSPASADVVGGGAAVPEADSGGVADAPGGAEPFAATAQQPTVAGRRAVRLASGLAAAPELAPHPVKQLIWHANRLIGRPYVYGGGHARLEDRGYDCSGTVSYPLVKLNLLRQPLSSSGFMRWANRGRGQWVTVYANAGHAFMTVAGLRLDTSREGDPRGQAGPRWRPAKRSLRGFVTRHPAGL
jgi:hypothetical protein